ncbi:hypothetical protein [Natronococcus wangiae]|uniref:hypothetical protein n=1 Tax=Natronococcus wangiae TaxID=3068275 RepID=UPI00273F46FC|nr:hypothetical protein [Natronococcus sp. AD5]
MPICTNCGEEHPLPGSYTSHVLTCTEGNGAAPTDVPIEDEDASLSSESDDSSESPLERHVEQIIDDHLDEIRTELDRLSSDVEDVEQFATISLGERRLTQAEANLAEFSASLTEFSEQTLERVNELESRLERQTIVLATVLEALAKSDVEVDVSDIKRYQQEQLVTDRSASDKLATAIDELDS